MVWNPNKTINRGKYTIQSVLGEGGFGITYFAIDNTNGNQVVIKTLNDTVQMRPDFAQFQQDFMNEALRLAKCHHPHIVKVFEVIQEGNLWCMVMEYAGKNDLGSLIHQRGVLSESEALYYTQQIGEALGYIHSLNPSMIHRDVKPANILIRNNQGKPQAILIDFGIAREFKQNLTQSQTPILSDGFAPIEQYDKRAKRGSFTDVYALAATLYAMVTGEMPTAAPARMMFSLTPPQQINPNMSDRLNQAILKGMELRPEDRPQYIGEWFNLLGLAYQGKSPQISNNGQNNLQNQGQQIQNNNLKSAKGIDYTKLQDYLSSKKWQDADIETRLILLKIAGKEKEGKLNTNDLPKIPAQDLQIIDRLWVEFSNGHFGFSVQRRIWEASARNWLNFARMVGWCSFLGYPKTYEKLNFSTSSPKGHLPVFGVIGLQFEGIFVAGQYIGLYNKIFSYFQDCGL